MQKTVLLTAILSTLFLTACGSFSPYVDSRREAGTLTTIGESTPDKISICYNSTASTPSKILALATKECKKSGKKPKFLGQKQWNCALFTPTRVEYLCQ